MPEVNLLALVAAQAAYQYGQPWLDEQLIYLRANRDRLTKRINAMPGLTVLPIEATYLAWIDCSALPVDNPHQFFERAGVGLSAGLDFGDRRFVRLNFGCRWPCSMKRSIAWREPVRHCLANLARWRRYLEWNKDET